MRCTECNGRGTTSYYVEIARSADVITIEQRECICRTCNGSGEQPMTNADRIRAMSDEELAEYFAEIGNDASNGISYSENPEEWLEWLKQPAEVIDNA